MKPTDTRVGMHIVRPANEARAVVIGESYRNEEISVWTTPVFYDAEVGDRVWFTANFEPDPDPPEDLWAAYVAWRLVQ